VGVCAFAQIVFEVVETERELDALTRLDVVLALAVVDKHEQVLCFAVGLHDVCLILQGPLERQILAHLFDFEWRLNRVTNVVRNQQVLLSGQLLRHVVRNIHVKIFERCVKVLGGRVNFWSAGATIPIIKVKVVHYEK